MPARHIAAHTNSFSNRNQGNPQTKLSPLKQEKGQSLSDQPPMPLAQLTRRTSQKATSQTRGLREICSGNLTLGNNHAHEAPSRINDPKTTRLEQHLKTIIQKLGHGKQMEPERLNKSNTPESELVTYHHLTFR
jgi:hypothetical protein